MKRGNILRAGGGVGGREGMKGGDFIVWMRG